MKIFFVMLWPPDNRTTGKSRSQSPTMQGQLLEIWKLRSSLDIHGSGYTGVPRFTKFYLFCRMIRILENPDTICHRNELHTRKNGIKWKQVRVITQWLPFSLQWLTCFHAPITWCRSFSFIPQSLQHEQKPVKIITKSISLIRRVRKKIHKKRRHYFQWILIWNRNLC